MSNQTKNGSRRILIVDDNHAIHEDFRKILSANPASGRALDAAEASLFGEPQAEASSLCFELDSAFQGKEGLERVQQALQTGNPYAMAFVDVRMPPGWDGIETTSKMWEVSPDLQVVICTAYSDYSWDDMIAKVGQSDRMVILKKPFDNVEVLQLANALTEKWRLLQQAKLRIGDLESVVSARTGELRHSEERFRLIAENAADLISIVDLNGQRLYHSPAFERCLGYSAEELNSRPDLPPVHPEDQQRFITAIRSALHSGAGQALEYRMQDKEGAWRDFESRESVVRNEQGEIASLIMTARDVTQRKAREGERQMMEVQLRHAQKLESIGQLAAGIAHEINTPTQYIGDNTRFLQDAFKDLNALLEHYEKLLPAAKENAVTPDLMAGLEAARQTADIEYLAAEIPKAIRQSLEGVERVSKIVRSMKEFSHPGGEDKTPVDLNRAIESTLTVTHSEWKYVADLVKEFDPALPAVPCLPGEMNQVILNLIINAAHAIADVVGDGSRGKGVITVRTRFCGDWVEIRVGDTGGGIPEKVRNRIFEPFFTTKAVGKGTGQGLAIAHSVVVEKHGGILTFETETGKGTTFIIRLPMAQTAAAGIKEGGMKKRILFVDDEPLILQGLQRMLRNLRAEWEMAFVESGAKALELMAQSPFDVVVSDMRMPGMNGAELLAEVMKRYPKTVRLILSGHADKDLILKCVGSTHQYLSKPCEPEMLRAAVMRAADLENSLQDQNLRQLVAQLDRLPSIPSLYVQIVETLQNPDVALEEVGQIIAKDMGMTAKILKLVNSAFFGLPRQISSPAQAVAYLGLDTIKSLVLSVNSFSQFEGVKLGGFSIEQLWSHSQEVAAGAKQIARKAQAEQKIIEEAFVAGLLHDTGKLVLASNFPEQYDGALRAQTEQGLDCLTAEKQAFGANHAEVGGYLLGLWGLPVPVVEAIAFHHCPSRSLNKAFSPLTAVHAANALAHAQESGVDGILGANVDLNYKTVGAGSLSPPRGEG